MRIRAKGFSLLELLIVVVIMGMVYVLVPGMMFGGVSGADLRASSRDIASGLRQARSLAVSGRRDLECVAALIAQRIVAPKKRFL